MVAGIGISDDSGTNTSAEFTISVDDLTRFQRTIAVGESAQTATADLTGAFRVTLTINHNCGRHPHRMARPRHHQIGTPSAGRTGTTPGLPAVDHGHPRGPSAVPPGNQAADPAPGSPQAP
ncbi:hypothetical protein [Kitasatospora cinereorecta]|uniref:hypothetical protein n=1 Tax=Streptomyces sp. NPDC057429 TaxID=3346130 RepID=UPI0036124B94